MSSSRKSSGEDSYYSSSSRRRRDRDRSRSRSRSRSRDQRHRDDGERDRRYRDSRDEGRRRRSRSRSRSRERHYDSSSRDNRASHHTTGNRGNSSTEPSTYRQPSEKDSSKTQSEREPGGISIKVVAPSIPYKSSPALIPGPIVKSSKVAAIFNDDDDDEPEEMPAEARMKMKNVGRNTPTSAGPNSFGKTKIGFCNTLHIAERELEEKQLK